MELAKKTLFFLFVVGAGACVSLRQPMPKVTYYTLEYEIPKMGELRPLPAVIKVAPFTAVPPYNSDRIIYRDGSFKRDAYVYHRWRMDPGDLVLHFLARDMRESGLFDAVLTQYNNVFPSYRLEGSVDEFFEWDRPASCEAVLTVTVTFLREGASGGREKILFQKVYQARKECLSKNPEAVAQAMSQAMLEVSKRILHDTYLQIKETPL